MKTKNIYLALSCVGAILPYWEFTPWVARHGLDMRLFFSELLANRISTFFGLDVIVSAVVLLIFMRVESRRADVPGRWIPILATLAVGVSLGLPLFLYMRELRLESTQGGPISNRSDKKPQTQILPAG